MALNKKPVKGMKDILPEEMQIRDYAISVIKEIWFHLHRDALCGEYCQSDQQAGRRQ